MEKLLKGMFFQEIVDQVHGQKGEKALCELERQFGKPLTFSNFKGYPLEDHLRLLELSSKIIFKDKDRKEAIFEMGKLSWLTFAQSMVGKTVLALYAKDLRKTALSIAKLWGMITNFGVRECQDLGERKVKIIIKEDPRPPEYIVGVLSGAVEFFKAVPKIETKVFSSEHCEFIVSWENPRT